MIQSWSKILQSLLTFTSLLLFATFTVIGIRSYWIGDYWSADITFNGRYPLVGRLTAMLKTWHGGIAIEWDYYDTIENASGKVAWNVFHLRDVVERDWELDHFDISDPTDLSIRHLTRHVHIGFGGYLQKSTYNLSLMKSGEDSTTPARRSAREPYSGRWLSAEVDFPTWFAVAIAAVLPAIYWRKRVRRRQATRRGFMVGDGS